MKDIYLNGQIVSDIRSVKLSGDTILIEHSDGTEKPFPFTDVETARKNFLGILAASDAAQIGNPAIISLTPAAVAHAGSGTTTIVISGVNFDSTAAVVIRSYANGDTVLTTTWINSTTLSVTLNLAQAIDVYDVIYSDSAGGTDIKEGGLVVY